MPDPAPQPVYAFRCFLASGFAGAFSVTCFALMFSLPDQWIRVAAVIGAMCAVMGVATTAVCLKLDTARREQFDLHNDLAVMGYRLTQLDRFVREAVDEQTSDLSAAVAELQATRTQMADFMKLYESITQSLADRIDALEGQQETLADLATRPERLVLDVANEEVYELGRRVGYEEAERKSRKDQSS